MSKTKLFATILTFLVLIWLAGKAVKKGIDFQEPWRVLATVIIIAIISAFMIENLNPGDNPEN